VRRSGSADGVYNLAYVPQHLIIPKAYYSKALGDNKRVALRIAHFLPHMDLTVNFHDQLRGATVEIHYEGSNDILPLEPHA
jgi:hypothetical protein